MSIVNQPQRDTDIQGPSQKTLPSWDQPSPKHAGSMGERKDHQQNHKIEFETSAQMSHMSLTLTFSLVKENQVSKPGVNGVGNIVLLQRGPWSRGAIDILSNTTIYHTAFPIERAQGLEVIFTCQAINTEGQGL